MPLFRKTVLPQAAATLALWRIKEDLTFFEPRFAASGIQNDSKRLQWYASRQVVNELAGYPAEVLNDSLGKPFIKDSGLNISITHTAGFAGAITSTSKEVGIDLETITPKVERIAHKFLYPEELAAIAPTEKTEKLILYWSAKESLYKLHGRKLLEFKTQLLIKPFALQQTGELSARIIAHDFKPDVLTIHYEFFEGHVLTYVVGL